MDYTKLAREYGAGYVAIVGLRVVASGRTFGEVLKKVEGLGLMRKRSLRFHFVPPEGAACVYHL